MGTVAVIQARMDSARLPGKVMKPILGRPMLWHIVQRVSQVTAIDQVVVATTARPADTPILKLCEESGCAVYCGSVQDVLDRFYQVARRFSADTIIRITADCPFVDPQVIANLSAFYIDGDYDHAGVVTGAGALFDNGGHFPDGLDAECFSFATLEYAWKHATHSSDREHVTPYIWQRPDRFRLGKFSSEKDYSRYRWTVDTEADLRLARRVYEALHREDKPFVMADILAYLRDQPQLTLHNRHLIGEEGYSQIWTK